MKINIVFVLCLVLSVLASVATAFAVDRTWVGWEYGNWADPGNWDPPGVPDFNDNVSIPPDAEVVAAGEIQANSLLIIEGAKISGSYLKIRVENLYIYEGTITGIINLHIRDEFRNENGVLRGEENEVLYTLIGEHEAINKGVIKGFGDDGSLNICCKGNFDNSGSVEGGTIEQLSNFSSNSLNNSNGSIGFGGRSLVPHFYLYLLDECENENGDFICMGPFNDPNPAGDNLNMFFMNEDGTAVLRHAGTIRGSNSTETYDGADNIYINADDFENWGTVETGNNGTGIGVYGGYTFIKAHIIRNYLGGHILSGLGGCPFIYGNDVSFSNYTGGSKSSTLDTVPALNGDFVGIVGTTVEFDSLPSNSIVGEYMIDITTTNLPGFAADFSGLSAANVFHCPYGDIEIKSDNVVAPAVGMNAICDPDPTMLTGSAGHLYVTLFAPFMITNQGVSDSVKYLIRNEHTYARSFNYAITSALGWITSISATTSVLDPWETEPVWVHYTIPDSLDTTTTDIVTVSVVISTWSDTVVTTLVAFPFDTLPTPLAVEENNPNLPEAFTISTYPNPFNSAVTIEAAARAEIEIFDLNGRIVERILPTSLIKGSAQRAERSYNWQPEASVGSGVYLVRSTVGEKSTAKRIVYLK